jgi:hypothetical protein
MPKGRKAIDLTGQQFGRLTVINRHGTQCGSVTWFCKCSCGGEKVAAGHNLRSGDTTSCGCVHKEVMSIRLTTHGMKGTRIYSIWESMKKRCRTPSSSSYANYGGRGIDYDARWEFFENFYADMGDPPSTTHTLDRRENDLGYSKDNCQWATRVEQNLNKRNNVQIEFNGITKPLTAWARELDINPSTLRTRIYRRGWTIEEALRGKR